MVIDNIALEIHITDHCNLNCKSCTHYSPISKENFLNLESLIDDLNIIKHKGIVNYFHEIRLLGGEPLLNPDIIEIIKKIRQIIPSKKIVLVTNGLLLKKMPNDFFKCCSKNNIIICITKYPGNVNYNEIKNCISKRGVECFFYDDRTTNNSFYESKLSYNKRSKLKNFYKCFDQSCWQIKGGKLFSCPQVAYVDILNNRLHNKFKKEKSDYIKLKDINRWKLLKYRFLPKSFCQYCVFPKKRFNWQQSIRDFSEWIE